MKVTKSKEIIERNIGHQKQVFVSQAYALLILQWHYQNN